MEEQLPAGLREGQVTEFADAAMRDRFMGTIEEGRLMSWPDIPIPMDESV